MESGPEINLGVICMRLNELTKKVNIEKKEKIEVQGPSHRGTHTSPGKLGDGNE